MSPVEESPKAASLAPSAGGSDDKQQHWDEKTSQSVDTLDVVNYREGVDGAVDLVAGAHADDTIDPEAAARVRRKIDWQILPLLFLLYTGACRGATLVKMTLR